MGSRWLSVVCLLEEAENSRIDGNLAMQLLGLWGQRD
jgi:hypothetical protein